MRAAGKILVGLLLLPMALATGYWYSQRTPDKPRFYIDDDTEADVWQLPIVDPYRLIATESASMNSPGYSRWGLISNKEQLSFHPDSINYEKGLILLHDADGDYGVVDISRKTANRVKVFSNFLKVADSLGVSGKLYPAEAVYTCWEQTRQLPWAMEIFARNCAENAPQ
ncbi:hypothetical protein JAO73_13715 [Hymenobacter sp. BT523]|uniref:hypothetical protein n=1 Tax=Hymenobacter sp. BT523 TaxID=2795725 RepID=UPI0018EE0E98|nr:hypothetical protein [Hymenobacter sp. BT523]MBJ6110075.1 hypothetical protein [Hymenobacter sp. BT523]